MKVGDICIGHGLVNWPELNDMQCTILSELVGDCVYIDLRSGTQVTGNAHFVHWANGIKHYVRAQNLRKLPPDSTFEPAIAENWNFGWIPGKVKEKVSE